MDRIQIYTTIIFVLSAFSVIVKIRDMGYGPIFTLLELLVWAPIIGRIFKLF